MEYVLSVQHLTKRIRGKTIVEDVSFHIRAGEIFGFLGPNGSGKTTTIRMLVDLIKPTSGEVYICGHSVQKHPEKALRYAGCIVENPEVYSYLTGWENLEHYARMLYGIGAARIAEVVETVRLGGSIHDKVKTYSLGMRQRLGIAQALLGRPRLLILDEPTNGLDPQGIRELRDFTRQLAKQGIGILISSHMLSEIQLMCDRYAVIHNGRIKAVGSMEQLAERTAGLVWWQLDRHAEGAAILGNDPAVRLPERDLPDLAVPVITADAASPAVATVMEFSSIPEVVHRLVQRGIGVLAVQPAAPTLENLFLELTGKAQEGEKNGTTIAADSE